MSILGVGDTSYTPPDTRLGDLQRAITRLQADAERNSRLGTLEYDERTRWRRFAQQLSEALK